MDMPPSERPPTQTTLCIVVPCFNEEEVLERFFRELASVLSGEPSVRWRVLFVDDGSQDQTLAILNALRAEDPHVAVCSLSRNCGHQIALTAGLDHAVGDVVVTMDCDLQHPPSVIPQMLESWREGNDIVSAIRSETEGISRAKRWSSSLFYRLFNSLSDTPIIPGAADFVLLSRPAYSALQEMPERHRFLRGMVSWVGFRRGLVSYTAPPRAAGISKYTTRKMIALSLNAVFSFSSRPLRLATRVGLGITLSAVAYLGYAAVRYLTGGEFVPGWASTMGVVLLIGGTQLIFLGLIGEYLARVFEEVKRRPLYFLRQTPCIQASDEPTPSPANDQGPRREGSHEDAPETSGAPTSTRVNTESPHE